MYLYNKTLVAGSNINAITLGHFMGKSDSQLIILRGTTLVMYNIIDTNCYHISTTPLFGIGRCIGTLHLIDYFKDLVILTSDSGNLTILEYDLDVGSFIPLIQYKIGKVGCLKETPGQYLQISPDNRYIAVGALSEVISIFPVQYTLSVDRRKIHFEPIKGLNFTVNQSLIYDIAWSEDSALYVYTAHTETQQRTILSLHIEDNTLQDQLILSINESFPNTVVTRILFNENHLVLICENKIIVHYDNQEEVYGFSHPGSCTVITSVCKSPLGLVLGSEEGNVFYLRSDSKSFAPIANPLYHGGYPIHICATQSNLFIFSNIGSHVCVPMSVIGESVIEQKHFTRFMASAAYLNHLQPIPTKLFISKYIGSIGSGSQGATAMLGAGYTFYISPVSLSQGRQVVPIENVLTMPSLSNPRVDDFFMMSFVKDTKVYRVSQFVNSSFQAVNDFPFITRETTLTANEHKGVYIQVTPTTVCAVVKGSRLSSWETTPDARIESAFIGTNTIVLVRKKQSILCLRWERDHFVSLEEFISKSEVTCVLEYDQFILVGSRDRSIRVYQMDNNSISEVSTLPIVSNPRYLFSFHSLKDTLFTLSPSSNDGTLFIGCDEGTLVLTTFKKDKPELEIIKTFLLDPSKDTINLSYSIFNNNPTLFIQSSSVFYLVHRSRIFDFIPVSIEMKNRILKSNEEHAVTYGNGGNFGFAVYKTAEAGATMFLWKKSILHNVKCDTPLLEGSIVLTNCSATCRDIVYVAPRTFLSLCSNTDKAAQPKGSKAINSLQSIFSNEYGQLLFMKYAISQITDEVITAVTLTVEYKPEVQEKKQYLILGLVNEYLKESFISYNICTDQPIEGSYGVTECWKIPVEAKVFRLIVLGSQMVAAVVGCHLRIYHISERGLSLVSQVKCTSSFVTDIHYEKNRFYIVDNGGVISVINNVMNQLVYLLRHDTHRSLMRCCVIDDVSLVVSDKYGNILIYRSLFPMNYLLNTSDRKLQDYRMNTSSSMTLIASYYVGELVTSIFTETVKGSRVITYSTIYGSVNHLYPIHNVNDLEVMTALESLIMGKQISPINRIVDDFRSTYVPCMSVVDGTICKLFFNYSQQEQEAIANQLDMTVSEVKKVILDIHHMDSDSQKVNLESK